MVTPRKLGYKFPAEWELHVATWVSFPYHEESFPGMLQEAQKQFLFLVKEISKSEIVRIIFHNKDAQNIFENLADKYNYNLNNCEFFVFEVNDVWCRDFGPAFLVNKDLEEKKIIVDWEFNAWGGKFPYEYDNQIPSKIADALGLKIYKPGIIMEGGSVDFNGEGTLITTKSCLLNKNRNYHLTQNDIEWFLCEYYGVDQIIWLEGGISGDDTDGHVDDITRFVKPNTVITMIETNHQDDNYEILKINYDILKNTILINGKKLEIIEIPMPRPIYSNGSRLPASYANFYITNKSIILPIFECPEDQIAIDIFKEIFPERDIIPLDSRIFIHGSGSFHCLTQQEPLV